MISHRDIYGYPTSKISQVWYKCGAISLNRNIISGTTSLNRNKKAQHQRNQSSTPTHTSTSRVEVDGSPSRDALKLQPRRRMDEVEVERTTGSTATEIVGGSGTLQGGTLQNSLDGGGKGADAPLCDDSSESGARSDNGRREEEAGRFLLQLEPAADDLESKGAGPTSQVKGFRILAHSPLKRFTAIQCLINGPGACNSVDSHPAAGAAESTKKRTHGTRAMVVPSLLCAKVTACGCLRVEFGCCYVLVPGTLHLIKA